MFNFVVLFFEFFKIGLFSIGGGLATVPFLYALCDKYEWFSKHELSNMIAVSESTPGPIGVNMATYTGFINGSQNGNVFMGILGGLIATIGLITPSIVIIMLVARVLEQFKENSLVKNAFSALRPAVIGLIAVAEYNIFKTVFFNNFTSVDYIAILMFAILTFISFKFKKLHPVFIILIGAIAGIVIKSL